MREFKFRAKDTYSNDWVCGSLVANISEPQIVDDSGYKTTIDVRTIGEYTGVTDKNGKEIYEGDILRYRQILADPTDNSFYPDSILSQDEGEVEYNNGSFILDGAPLFVYTTDNWPCGSVDELLDIFGMEIEDDFKKKYGIDPKDVFGVEVIGNIYDKH